jgi:Lauroyl/myristoyl acyltransferase
MDIKEYYEQLEELELRSNVEFTPSTLGDYEKTFVLTSANLSKLMPDIPKKEYVKFCRFNYFYKCLATIQVQYTKIIEDARLTGNLDFTQSKTPRIFCTFHMGSYRLINLLLYWHGIDFVLVLSKETLKEQKEQYLKAYDDIRKLRGMNSTFEFIEAENPSSMLSMVRALKKGKSLLFYIDGNTGVGGIGKTDDKMLPIKFLATTIYARKGIAFLSHKCNVPIINCFSYIKEHRDIVTMQFNDPINPADGDKDINSFCMNTTQKIYDEFAEVLKLYPEQWEGWIYINRYMDLNMYQDTEEAVTNFGSDKKFAYNHERFNTFTHTDQQYLFDNLTYNTYPITQEFVDMLNGKQLFTLDDPDIPEDIFHFLVNKKILFPLNS